MSDSPAPRSDAGSRSPDLSRREFLAASAVAGVAAAPAVAHAATPSSPTASAADLLDPSHGCRPLALGPHTSATQWQWHFLHSYALGVHHPTVWVLRSLDSLPELAAVAGRLGGLDADAHAAEIVDRTLGACRDELAALAALDMVDGRRTWTVYHRPRLGRRVLESLVHSRLRLGGDLTEETDVQTSGTASSLGFADLRSGADYRRTHPLPPDFPLDLWRAKHAARDRREADDDRLAPESALAHCQYVAGKPLTWTAVKRVWQATDRLRIRCPDCGVPAVARVWKYGWMRLLCFGCASEVPETALYGDRLKRIANALRLADDHWTA